MWNERSVRMMTGRHLSGVAMRRTIGWHENWNGGSRLEPGGWAIFGDAAVAVAGYEAAFSPLMSGHLRWRRRAIVTVQSPFTRISSRISSNVIPARRCINEYESIYRWFFAAAVAAFDFHNERNVLTSVEQEFFSRNRPHHTLKADVAVKCSQKMATSVYSYTPV